MHLEAKTTTATTIALKMRTKKYDAYNTVYKLFRFYSTRIKIKLK